MVIDKAKILLNTNTDDEKKNLLERNYNFKQQGYIKLIKDHFNNIK